MEIAKSFRRDGVLYRPGDALPEGLDKVTLTHYKRYGMIAEPEETKPAGPARRRSPSRPANSKPTGPAQTQSLQPGLQADGSGALQPVHTSALDGTVTDADGTQQPVHTSALDGDASDGGVQEPDPAASAADSE
ncbi:hypothetical protein [Comamonas odontotermitis]|uniref:hypothetical protein n=1 Tax=Comamonas odontotermitis TaxID=379895 RepID=UPI003751B1C6